MCFTLLQEMLLNRFYQSTRDRGIAPPNLFKLDLFAHKLNSFYLSFIFHYRNDHILKGIPHFRMTDQKMDCRRFVFGNYNPFSLTDINLYISKCRQMIFYCPIRSYRRNPAVIRISCY